MPIRIPMPDDAVFHIFNRSIAGFNIFSGANEYEKFTSMLSYFLNPGRTLTFSEYVRRNGDRTFAKLTTEVPADARLQLIAYCLMPTHFHLVLFQRDANAISNFMHDVQSSYSQFFNLKHNRKGPLWEGRFKHVLCETEDQLLHLTRYVHLNPVTARLVERPEEWAASSYQEYIATSERTICCFKPFLEINPATYQSFVQTRINDQRMLAEIKKMLLD